MIKIVIYTWPDSQICTDCINGVLLNSEEELVIYGSSAYRCKIACEDNDGINCPENKER